MRLAAALALLVGTLTSASHLLSAQAPLRPRLIVLLIVDQMRADYVSRYGAHWRGGLARLFAEGAWFQQARYPFANTVTCAGHASVSTGTLPSRHGLIGNTWLDRASGRVVGCADDPSTLLISHGRTITATGSSAHRLLVPTIADSMQAQLPTASRVAAFSLKARSAVTLGGRRPDVIAWVADEGAWVSSTAFPQDLSANVGHFVTSHLVDDQLWTSWNRSLAPHAYGRDEAAIGPTADVAGRFPHLIRTWKEWEESPGSDRYLAQMALDVAEHLQLGAARHSDYLAISFSALDLVGHDYGPDSHEVQEVLFQLDRTVGELLNGLDRLVGGGNYTVALTADHGVAPIPERALAGGMTAGRIPARAIPEAAQRAILALLGPGQWVNRLVSNELYLKPEAVARLRAQPNGIDAVKSAVDAVPGVAAVYFADDLALPPRNDERRARVAKSFMRARSGDFAIVLEPYWLVGSANNANHGTAHDYDAHVPLVLAGWGIKPGTYTGGVSPLDVAPTLARLLGITLKDAQGRVLTEALRAPLQ